MRKLLFLSLSVTLLSVANKNTLHAQLVGSGGSQQLTLNFEDNNTYLSSTSALSVSADNGYSSALPFVFAGIQSSVHVFTSTHGSFVYLTMSGNRVVFSSSGVTQTPIFYQIPLAAVDNGNGAYVTFYPTPALNNYVMIRKSSNGQYYYKAF